jgi:hypothetical protein
VSQCWHPHSRRILVCSEPASGKLPHRISGDWCHNAGNLIRSVASTDRPMSLKVGFVLITHDKPHRAIRLVRKLNYMFDAPAIAWHHDFTQCTIPSDSITTNISLVRPNFQTSWATFSIVEAMLGAVKLLFQSKNPPDWFFLLSGADYPIKTADKIVHDLSMSQYDAHISHEKICFNEYENPWQELCYRRYCSLRLSIPLISRSLKLTRRTVRLSHPLITTPFLPFSKTLSCFAGQFWFCANRLAAEYLIGFHTTEPALANHYRRTDQINHDRRLGEAICPDESYCQTVLCNAPHLKLSKNHWRYIDWSQHGAHPKTLLIEDLPQLQESTAHFARKFDADVDDKVLDALDALT